MNLEKIIFLDKTIRCGGFFELSIQVEPSTKADIIGLYKTYLWNLENIDGPYDESYNKAVWSPDSYREEGIMHLGEKFIPFKTHYIQEQDPPNTQWFDVSLYTATVDRVFHQVRTQDPFEPAIPGELDAFLTNLALGFFKVHPFELAYIGFEIAQDYQLEDLKSGALPINSAQHFFIAEKDLADVSSVYHKLVTSL